MLGRRTIAGISVGVMMGIGGVAGVELATQNADAQGGGAVTQADLQAANLRSQAAINGYKSISNNLGKYLAEPGELIGARSGPIRQDRGVGGGLPEKVLSAGVQAKLNKAPRTVTSAPAPIAGFATGSASARCADDERVTGGGYELGDNAVAERSAPSADGRGWEVRAFAGGGGGSVQAFAICVKG